MARAFAVFDIDGTLVRTALFLQIVDELLNAGHLPSEFRTELDAKWEAYRTRAHPDAFIDYNQTTVDILFANLAKIRVVDYRQAVDAVIKKSRDQIYVYTRDLVISLKDQGYFLIALSGSEQYAVEQFTKQYGFDVVAGDVYQEENDMFTGQIDTVFGDKGAALQRIIAEHELSWEASWAVGDSAGDGKMLELVQHPIAFNPEAKLYELAKANGWPIVLERKNVIYNLEPRSGQYLLA